MNEPAVSVCIPTYNYAHYLSTALDSVLAQSFGDFEVLVVDNASEDDTAEVLARYADPRLRVHRNPRNLGLFGNFARCLELARAPLVKFLAADDWLDPRFLEEAVALMRAHPSAAIVSGPGWYVDDAGAVYGVGTVGVLAPGLVDGATGLRAQAEHLNVVGMPSNVLLRRSAVDGVGGFDERFAPAADVHLWGKLLAAHDLAWLPEPRSFLRIHQVKAHDYGLDPSASTFLGWEDLADRVDPAVVRRALAAEADRSLLHAAAHLAGGRVRRARALAATALEHVPASRAVAGFARRLPTLARGQLARVLARRSGRLVVYAPEPRMGAPLPA